MEYLDASNINGLNLYCYCLNDPVNKIDPNGNLPQWLHWLSIGLAAVGVALVIGAAVVLTCGVGALAGTMAGAIMYSAAKGIVIGAVVGTVSGGIIGGISTNGSIEGILVGAGIGLGAGAIIGGIAGGISGANSYITNSAYISKYGGNVKEVLSGFKGNPKLTQISKGTQVYRFWGGNAQRYGRWASQYLYSDPINKLSLVSSWGNTANTYSVLTFNQDVLALVGNVSAQGGLTGGGIQMFLGSAMWFF